MSEAKRSQELSSRPLKSINPSPLTMPRCNSHHSQINACPSIKRHNTYRGQHRNVRAVQQFKKTCCIAEDKRCSICFLNNSWMLFLINITRPPWDIGTCVCDLQHENDRDSSSDKARMCCVKCWKHQNHSDSHCFSGSVKEYLHLWKISSIQAAYQGNITPQ